MVTLTRKQREIQEREQNILRTARRMLLDDGYQNLTMERLAAEMEYAKGTIYNHFPNKEEIAVAVAIESMELRRSIFEKMAMSHERSRYRLAAIGTACDWYARECMDHFSLEQLVRDGAILGKSSEIRLNLVKQCEQRIVSIVAGVVRDGVASGDLVLPKGMAPEELVFGFWSLMFGSQLIMATSPTLAGIGIADPTRSIRFHAWTLMNGYHWQPMITFEETEVWMESLKERLDEHVRP